MSLTGSDLLDRLVETSPWAIVVSDLRGRIVLFSPGAERALGYRAAEAIRHVHVTDLYHRPDDARRVLERLRDRIATPDAPAEAMELTLRSRAGELIPTRLFASMVHDASGAAMGTMGVFEDRREAAALVRRLEDATGQVLASEKRAAAVAVASEAAHELSQPLMAAMGNLELLLLSSELSPELTARLERAYEQLERMRRIVGDFSRVTTFRGGRVASDSSGG